MSVCHILWQTFKTFKVCYQTISAIISKWKLEKTKADKLTLSIIIQTTTIHSKNTKIHTLDKDSKRKTHIHRDTERETDKVKQRQSETHIHKIQTHTLSQSVTHTHTQTPKYKQPESETLITTLRLTQSRRKFIIYYNRTYVSRNSTSLVWVLSRLTNRSPHSVCICTCVGELNSFMCVSVSVCVMYLWFCV